MDPSPKPYGSKSKTLKICYPPLRRLQGCESTVAIKGQPCMDGLHDIGGLLGIGALLGISRTLGIGRPLGISRPLGRVDVGGSINSFCKCLWSASLDYRQGHSWVAPFSPSVISCASWRGQLGKNEILFPTSSILDLELTEAEKTGTV